MPYIMQINLTPELFSGVPYFFWCIFEYHSNDLSNAGHGWSTSIEQAFHDAQTYISKLL